MMRPLPFNVAGFDNHLNEKIDRVMQRAVADETAVVYAFGERWGPEPRAKDKYFGFLPGNGIHDIHMNQGNSDRFVGDVDGWALVDTQKKHLPHSGELGAGATRTVRIEHPLALSNQGGIISLLDETGLKVHGVPYTREQARHPGWTIVF